MPKIYDPDGNIFQRRPTETAMPIATVLAALIAKALGVADTDTILYLALALSFVPTAVTWVVELIRKRDSAAVTPRPPTTQKAGP